MSTAGLLVDEESVLDAQFAATPCETSDDAPAPTTVKVLHVINGEHYAGAERVQDLLALGLPEEGFSVGFACVKPDRFPRLRQARQAPLFELLMRGRGDLRPVRRLARILRDEGYALVHTHTPRAAFVGRAAALLAGLPVVHHLHSPTTADSTHQVRNWLNAAGERLCIAGVAAVIAVSQSLGRYARRMGIRRQRIRVVHNGVPTRGPLVRRKPPTDAWVLGTVALFRPRKGLEVLLAALAELRAGGHNVRLRAVGPFETPDYERRVRQLAEQLAVAECIDWRGFIADVNGELDRMDMLVLPSLFGEGLPMVVLEAMAAGLPVIATRVEGVPEAMRDCVDGLLAAPGDAHDLAASIGRVVSGEVDWSRLRAQAHQRQADHFSAQSMAAGVAALYREILD